MRVESGPILLRVWDPADLDALVAAADDPRLARNMTDRFPSPYTRSHGESWIADCRSQGLARHLAIEAGGAFAGAIGVDAGSGERRHVGSVGYWVAADHWNRGIATAALGVFTRYVFSTFRFDRLEATVFGWNPASGRVLEKCGYRLEGRLRGAIAKGDERTDELLYGLLRSDPLPPLRLPDGSPDAG